MSGSLFRVSIVFSLFAKFKYFANALSFGVPIRATRMLPWAKLLFLSSKCFLMVAVVAHRRMQLMVWLTIQEIRLLLCKWTDQLAQQQLEIHHSHPTGEWTSVVSTLSVHDRLD